METNVLLVLISSMFAIPAGAFLVDAIIKSIDRERVAISISAPKMRDRIAHSLKRGFPLLMPLSKRLLAIPKVNSFIERVTVMLEELEYTTSADALLSLLIALSISTGILTWLVTSSPVFGIACGAIIVIAIFGFLNNRCDKRNMLMREEVPEALRCMSACFRSGQSLLQTMKHSGKEIAKPLGQVFAIAARRLDLGEPPAEALSILRSNRNVPELSFVAVALDVQHQTGGTIAPVLEAARDSVEGELELMRSLRIQTAQAKLSASIVTIMPFILVALFSLMSPDFLSPFFTSVAGMALLGLALLMQLSGVLIVRRMLKVDVG